MEYQLPALIWLLWDLKLLRQKHLQQVTVAFWTSLSLASLSAMYALYQISVRQATISLSLLRARTSRCEPWESLWGSSATTPLVDFHHRLMACPSHPGSDSFFKPSAQHSQVNQTALTGISGPQMMRLYRISS